MNGTHYQQAAVIPFIGRTRKTFCCLQHLAYSDEEFVGYLNSNPRLRRAFDLIANDDNEAICMADLDEADEVAVLFVEYALRNRARFAVIQKAAAVRYIDEFQEDDQAKQAVMESVDSELNYASRLLRRLVSNGAKFAKGRVMHWLGVSFDGPPQDVQEGAANADAENDGEGSARVAEVSDDEEVV